MNPQLDALIRSGAWVGVALSICAIVAAPYLVRKDGTREEIAARSRRIRVIGAIVVALNAVAILAN